MNKRKLTFFALAILLVLLVIFPNSPLSLCNEIPSRDSGVFLYVGETILDGGIPYRDVWDHKPPLVYFLNAFGLFIGGESMWGIWFLEFISLFVALLLSFILMRRVFGLLPAVIGSLAWLFSLTYVLGRGNFAEEYALSFQFMSLYLFWAAEKEGRYAWRGYLIGILASLCFLLKPNLIGIHISIVFLLFLNRAFENQWRRLATDFFLICTGAVSVIVIIIIYLSANGALADFYDQVFRYNFIYSTMTLSSMERIITNGFNILSISGLPIIALTAWFIGVICIWLKSKHMVHIKNILYIAIIGLPLEILLLSIPGKQYHHYYIAWLPIFSLLVCFFAYILQRGLTTDFKLILRQRETVITLSTISLIAMILAIATISGKDAALRAYSCARYEPQGVDEQIQAIEYIRESTTDSDYVLMWGAETSFNFLSDRRSPTRYVYQYPLYTSKYCESSMTEEFVNNITDKKPALIIDTSPSNPRVPPLDSIDRAAWSSEYYRPDMDVYFSYIESNYHLIKTIGTGKWPVYSLIGRDV